MVDTREPDQHVREHYLNVGASYTSPAFTVAGSYNYICGIHGAVMAGIVNVQAGGPSTAAVNIVDFAFNPASVTVGIGGHPMIVTFAGLAPGFVGLYQINFTVPGDRVQGDTLPVIVKVGTASSPACAGSDPTVPCAGVPIAAIP